MDLALALEFVAAHRHGVLVTLRRDGRPQLSNIFYLAGPDGTVRVSVTDDRAKTANLRRDPRAQLYVTRDDFFAYVVLDGTASLSPVAGEIDDPVVDELVDMYRLGRIPPGHGDRRPPGADAVGPARLRDARQLTGHRSAPTSRSAAHACWRTSSRASAGCAPETP
jgi:PPOX class probable F420-dependent enzyme